ncbi:MAG: DNA-3-methyladenine glycosylase I [Dehalococcoidia bacterium]
MERCPWAASDPLLLRYHDEEWGTPVHDDRVLFEFLVLEGFQAGLSWLTILRKRDGFSQAFDGFDVEKVARYTQNDIQRLISDPAIVRNRAKIEAAISNARRVLEVRKEYGSFARYIWQFTGHKTLRRSDTAILTEIPASSPESDALARDLKQRGFRFIGTTTCYAFMQSVGMVNDHLPGCFKAQGSP